MSTQIISPQPIRRLTRLEQLTLNTWRWAAATPQNTLDPVAVVEEAALHAVLAALRDLDDPRELFRRHAHAQSEFQLILSVLREDHRPGLPHDILDAAFLLRWTELIAGGAGHSNWGRSVATPAADPRSDPTAWWTWVDSHRSSARRSPPAKGRSAFLPVLEAVRRPRSPAGSHTWSSIVQCRPPASLPSPSPLRPRPRSAASFKRSSAVLRPRSTFAHSTRSGYG